MADLNNGGRIPVMGLLFDPNTPPGNAGAGGGDPNAGGGGGNTNPNADPNGGGNPNANGKPDANGNVDPNAGKKVFTYQEDRTDWVPRHRLNEQATKFERDMAELRKEIKSSSELGTRLRQALDPNGGGDPAKQREAQETRAALLELFPELGSLAELRQAVAGSQETVKAQWTRHATEMLTGLQSEAATALGVEKIDDNQSKHLQRLYRAEAQDCAQARQRAFEAQDQTYDWNNDFIARHERGDKTLLKEFVKAVIDGWVEPGRRIGTSEATRRLSRPVPRGDRTRQLPAGGPPQINYNDEDAFKKALITARNAG